MLDVRCDFPFLNREVNGSPLIYFDNAATTQKPRAVIECIQNLYASGVANVHRAVNFLAEEVTELFEESRRTVARFIGAHPREIVFVSGSTHALNFIAASLNGSRPPRVLTTTLEHHSNLLPWKNAEFIPWAASGVIDTDALHRKLRTQPDLVAITHASNFLGTIQPVREIIAACKERHVPVLVDASQSIAHVPVNVRELECDYLVFSGHKIYGPSGTGVLYIHHKHLDAIRPLFVGGSMVKEVHAGHFVMNDIPYRFEAGTPNIEGVIGLGTALNYLNALGYEAVAQHECRLVEYARERLARIPGLTLYGPPSGTPSAPLVSFQMRGLESGAITKSLAGRANIIVRSGFLCAQPAHNELGIGPTVRASFGIYNTLPEIDCMAELLETLRRYMH
jgi:cysteine desulfurase/selenocysteine lyase